MGRSICGNCGYPLCDDCGLCSWHCSDSNCECPDEYYIEDDEDN